MSGLTRAALGTDISNNVYTNTQKLIKGNTVKQRLLNLNDSSLNILSDLNVSGGYLGIDSNGRVDVSFITDITPTGKFLRDDGSWQTVSAGGAPVLNNTWVGVGTTFNLLGGSAALTFDPTISAGNTQRLSISGVGPQIDLVYAGGGMRLQADVDVYMTAFSGNFIFRPAFTQTVIMRTDSKTLFKDSGRTVQLGGRVGSESTFGGIYFADTPTNVNYALIGNNNQTYLNGLTDAFVRINDNDILQINATRSTATVPITSVSTIAGNAESIFKNLSTLGFTSIVAYNEDNSVYASLNVFNSASGVGTLYDNNSAWSVFGAASGGLINETPNGRIKIATGGFGSSKQYVEISDDAIPFTFWARTRTALTASVELNNFKMIGGNFQWSPGAITTQRSFYLQSNSYRAISASTFSDVYNLFVEENTASTNATFTRNWAAGFQGNVSVTGSVVANSGSFQGFGTGVIKVTTSATLTDSQCSCLANGTSSITITLPTAVGKSGTIYCVKNISAYGIQTFVATTSSQTIDNNSSVTLEGLGGPAGDMNAVYVISDGANWWILNYYFNQ